MPSPGSGTAGQIESPTVPEEAFDADQADPGQVEQVKAGQRQTTSGKYGSQTVPAPQQPSPPQQQSQQNPPNEPDPTIEARWSKAEITVDHNSAWPPATPPTDTVPDEAKVELNVTTTNVPDGKSATITIYNAFTKKSVVTIYDLEVKGGKVIVTATGKNPEWKALTSKRWEPWDHPVFYFTVNVAYKGLTKTTPTAENSALRLKYWHCCVSDYIADHPLPPQLPLTTGDEMNEIGGILEGLAHHKVLKQSVNQANVPTALWGSALRNTYAYHHASHGDIVDRTTGAQLDDGNNNPPKVAVGNWRSVIVLGDTNLGDAEVSNEGAVPSTPRYLAYLNTCVAGWEPSFANAFISRGTQNVIAFRCYIPDDDARAMARNFHKKWCNTHKCDPAKIPEIFFDVGAAYYKSMRPVLFGQGGGPIPSATQKAMSAVGKAIKGAVSSITSLFH